MGLFDSLFNKNRGADSSSHIKSMANSNVSEDSQIVIDDELPSVNRRKGQGKLIEMLGVTSLVGAGVIVLYFVNTDNAKKIEEPTKKLVVANRLPPLEMPPPPPPPPPEVAKPGSAPIGLAPDATGQPNANVAGGPPKPTWLDRRMGGGMVLGQQSTAQTATTSPDGTSGAKLTNVNAPVQPPNPLALRLNPTTSPGVTANLLPNRDYIITKGTALDCALETAIDSTVPGMTTCRLTRDVYSDNGHVVLLDRGSQLVGEYQGGITAGQARIFVLWTRAKTPNGVIVNLDSPGTDALGRSGHAGWVDTHFMERFGAAIILSLVKDGFRIAQNNNQENITIGGGGSDQLATEILKNTINIPPTLYINQGDHIQVMVARDLDFSTVYGLELKE